MKNFRRQYRLSRVAMGKPTDRGQVVLDVIGSVRDKPKVRPYLRFEFAQRYIGSMSGRQLVALRDALIQATTKEEA